AFVGPAYRLVSTDAATHSTSYRALTEKGPLILTVQNIPGADGLPPPSLLPLTPRPDDGPWPALTSRGLADPFLPAHARLQRAVVLPGAGAVRTYHSADLAASFPPSTFPADSVPGALYATCGDDPDQSAGCTLALGQQ